MTMNNYHNVVIKANEIGITTLALLEECSLAGLELNTFLHNRCNCKTIGLDDGAHTCFEHHDCSRQECTHTDGGDEDDI